ncbi:MAG TPA: response regulator, partial [Chloroflexota bacterium]|nr:response regulator [Chloroflexota bacterium]
MNRTPQGGQSPPGKPTDVGSKQRPARILLIVEQPVLAELVRTALSHGYFTIQSASRWQEVSRLAFEWHPHLVLLDLELGEGGLLNRLKGLPNPIPVIG